MDGNQAHKLVRQFIPKRDGKVSGLPGKEGQNFTNQEFVALAKAALVQPVVQVSGDYVVEAYDGFIEVNTIGALITLPGAGEQGKEFEIKNNTNGIIYVDSVSNIGGDPDQWSILAGATFCVYDNGQEYIIK